MKNTLVIAALFTCSTALAFGAGCFLARRGSPPDLLEVQQLMVVDGQGRPRIRLGEIDGGFGIQLINAKDSPRMLLLSRDEREEAFISLAGQDGEQVRIWVKDDGFAASPGIALSYGTPKSDEEVSRFFSVSAPGDMGSEGPALSLWAEGGYATLSTGARGWNPFLALQSTGDPTHEDKDRRGIALAIRSLGGAADKTGPSLEIQTPEAEVRLGMENQGKASLAWKSGEIQGAIPLSK